MDVFKLAREIEDNSLGDILGVSDKQVTNSDKTIVEGQVINGEVATSECLTVKETTTPVTKVHSLILWS